MILCLDIGNSQIFGGIFDNDELKFKFRHDSKQNYSSDQYGIFFKNVLTENDIDVTQIKHISICSVVPQLDYSIVSACKKYLSLTPFILQPGVKTGLQIKYNNPLEVGADRIANAIAAINQFANKNIIIIDFGTATTICAISKNKEYLGGTIFAGIKLAMHALQSNTSKLSHVEIVTADNIIGKSTTESIQAGLYYSQLATIKFIKQQLSNDFLDDPIVIGTGGFAHLFANQNIFSIIIPDLVLHGLKLALQKNIL